MIVRFYEIIPNVRNILVIYCNFYGKGNCNPKNTQYLLPPIYYRISINLTMRIDFDGVKSIITMDKSWWKTVRWIARNGNTARLERSLSKTEVLKRTKYIPWIRFSRILFSLFKSQNNIERKSQCYKRRKTNGCLWHHPMKRKRNVKHDVSFSPVLSHFRFGFIL